MLLLHGHFVAARCPLCPIVRARHRPMVEHDHWVAGIVASGTCTHAPTHTRSHGRTAATRKCRVQTSHSAAASMCSLFPRHGIRRSKRDSNIYIVGRCIEKPPQLYCIGKYKCTTLGVCIELMGKILKSIFGGGKIGTQNAFAQIKEAMCDMCAGINRIIVLCVCVW